MKKTFLFAICFIFLHALAHGADYSKLKNKLSEIIGSGKFNVGLSLYVDGKPAISINDNSRYPLMSVFKFHQALAVCDHLQKNRIPLDRKIHVSRSDLQKNTWSPLRDSFPEGNLEISVRDLLRYTLQQSDNNACDILFKYLVGPADTDKYIRSLGAANFSISKNEKAMHDNIYQCYDNWTRPSEVSKLLDLFVSEMASANECAFAVKELMTNCETGQNRLLKYIGENILAGHKTGTGDRNGEGRIIGINDAGFFILPDGSRYTLSIFIKDAEGSLEENEELIARLSREIYDSLKQPAGQ